MVRPAPKRLKKSSTNKKNDEKQLPQSSSEYIKTITQLKRKPDSEKALFLLHKIASLVKPIMKSHGFKVGTLCEFFPKDQRLLGLNVNHGMKICIRLRPSYDEAIFYPLEDVVGTMLHELTHNKFGPHDQKFYKFLDEITSELEELMAGGFTGDGFFSNGKTLGGAKPISMEQARKKALEAIEKRKVLYSGSGQKLGGEKTTLSMKELILMAAERRAKDNKWCGSQHIPAKEDLGIEDEDLFEMSETDSKSRSESEKAKENTPTSTRDKGKTDTTKKRNVVVILDSDEEDGPVRRGNETDQVFIDLTDD